MPFGASAASEVQALAQKVSDWNEFRDLVVSHGVTSLVASALRDANAAPVAEAQWMETKARSTLASNLLAIGQLGLLLECCKKEAIRVLVFKGPALAGEYYDDLGQREFGDIDVLVDKADSKRMGALLRRLKYEPAYAMTEEQEVFELRWRGEAMYSSPNGVCFDVHTWLSASTFPIPLSFEELWSRRRLIVVAGRKMNTFSHEDLALYLAIHGCKHLWQRLIWCCDFARMLKSDSAVHWENVWSTVKKLRLEMPLLIAVNVAASALGAPIPPAIGEALAANKKAGSLADLALQQFDPGGGAMSMWKKEMYHFRWTQRPGSMAQNALTRVFLPHPPDWQSLPLPKPLWFFYTLYRPARLCWKSLTDLAQKTFLTK